MALKIFKKEIEPQCALCEFGSTAFESGAVLCRKIGGIMQPYSKCKKFNALHCRYLYIITNIFLCQ